MSTHRLHPIRPLARVLMLAAPALVLLAAPPTPAAAQEEGAPTASATAATTPAVLHACYVPSTGTVYRIKEPGLRQECAGPPNGPNQHVEFSWSEGVPDNAHANLNGLDADDHPQYLPADGSRPLTGDLSADGHTITGLGAASAPGEAVRFEQAVKSGDGAGGDLDGSYPAPTVAGLRGNPVGSDAPGSGDVLTWDGSEWHPAAPSDGGVTDHGALTGLGDNDHPQYLLRAGDALTGDLSAAGHRVTNLAEATASGEAVPFEQAVKSGDAAAGDLAGLYPNPTLTGIQGQPLAASSPADGEVLTYDGSQWEPQAPPAGGVQGIERVRVLFEVPAESTLNGFVDCPDGKVVLGSGFGAVGSGIEIFQSFPDHELTSWIFRFRNRGTFDQTALVYATCANGST